ncbi:MAG: amino acid transporter [Planctomycetota bacterium]
MNESAPPLAHEKAHPQHFWLWVMCLTGVDYFSTLGYQPSIAFEATGVLTPFATVILVLVTLFGAFPVYAYVAGKSPHGQGSIAMLERLLHGWSGKILVLVLLGFAGTDFVITKTLSAADAAVHLLENPIWPAEWRSEAWQIGVTMLLLVILAATFLRGFNEVIGIAVVIVAIYLILNTIVVGSGLLYLRKHPEALESWLGKVQSGDWRFHNHFSFGPTPWGILATCILLFPKLALGLSGFETGVAVMPLIRGRATDTHDAPHGRVRNARKLLLTSALIMSVYLLGSSLVVSTLIGSEKLLHDHDTNSKGPAAGRALAYLAHGEDLSTGESATALNPMFGPVFGTVYDVSTIVILWFAGASAMAGLLNLIPHYLPRYGMAPEWARALRPLVFLFMVINLVVTWIFRADVEAQGGAYATGVLVLMSSGCIATVVDRWRHGTSPRWWIRTPWYFVVVTFVFLYTTAANMFEKPDGIKIASFFIVAIIVSSIVSRFMRVKELRLQELQFYNDESNFLWNSMKHLEFPVLVPHRPGTRSLKDKEAIIRKEHRLAPDVPIVFIEAQLGDTSDFYQSPRLEVLDQEGSFILRVHQCASIAHTIAALALELSKTGAPPEIHFGWSAESPLTANIGFLLFGEGNVPWMVRELILGAEDNPERQPRVVIG